MRRILNPKVKVFHAILSTQWQSDAQYWRTTAGYSLATFLHCAGYSRESQQRHVAFFNDFVAPELGQKHHTGSPNGQWSSFMTDDGTPLEISWDWGFDRQQATIRYSIEPIGSEAGSSLDPLNKYASSCFLQNMRKLLPEADWQWSEHFEKEFCVFNEPLEHDNEAHKLRFYSSPAAEWPEIYGMVWVFGGTSHGMVNP